MLVDYIRTSTSVRWQQYYILPNGITLGLRPYVNQVTVARDLPDPTP